MNSEMRLVSISILNKHKAREYLTVDLFIPISNKQEARTRTSKVSLY